MHKQNGVIIPEPHAEPPRMRGRDLRLLRAALRVWELKHPEVMPVRPQSRQMRRP